MTVETRLVVARAGTGLGHMKNAQPASRAFAGASLSMQDGFTRHTMVFAYERCHNVLKCITHLTVYEPAYVPRGPFLLAYGERPVTTAAIRISI
eukprot:6202264-Pleurochrysis_carterae.AAC.1